MRILTNSQYDAIVDIVTDLQKENAKLTVKLREKEETIDYLHDKLFERTKEVAKLRFEKTPMMHIASIDDLDFPATKPENKFI